MNNFEVFGACKFAAKFLMHHLVSFHSFQHSNFNSLIKFHIIFTYNMSELWIYKTNNYLSYDLLQIGYFYNFTWNWILVINVNNEVNQQFVTDISKTESFQTNKLFLNHRYSRSLTLCQNLWWNITAGNNILWY